MVIAIRPLVLHAVQWRCEIHSVGVYDVVSRRGSCMIFFLPRDNRTRDPSTVRFNMDSAVMIDPIQQDLYEVK